MPFTAPRRPAAAATGKPSFREGPASVPHAAHATANTSNLVVVPLTPELVSGVLRVQYAAYAEDLHETAESYMDKLAASPGTSFAALCPAPVQPLRGGLSGGEMGVVDKNASMVVGYAVTLAVPRYFLPSLDCANTGARLAEVCAATAATKENDALEPTIAAAPGRNEENEENASVDTLYLHDVAVDPAFRGQRVAAHLLREAERKRAEIGLPRMALIAVRGADKFWRKIGFSPITREKLPVAVRQKLEGYGADAVYMEKFFRATTRMSTSHKSSSL